MYTSFTIENFRCFPKLKIEPLARINLIAGQNNIGKTAFLEAIFIFHAANPGSLTSIEYSRGFQKLRRDELFWDLFPQFNAKQTIRFSGTENNDEVKSLEIRLQEQPTESISLERETTNSLLKSSPDEISFTYGDTFGQMVMKAYAEDDDDGFRLIFDKSMPNRRVAFLLARKRVTVQMLATRLSTLRAEKRHREIIEILQIIEPRLIDLEVLSIEGNNMVFADIETMPKLIPILLLGEGTVRLLEIALVVTGLQGHILLIDEIENGFHHSIMSRVWEVIAQLARKYDVQVFATTHSWESIQAAHKVFFKKEPNDFLFHRLEKVDDAIQVVTLDQDALQTTLEEGWEIR